MNVLWRRIERQSVSNLVQKTPTQYKIPSSALVSLSNFIWDLIWKIHPSISLAISQYSERRGH